MALAYQVGQALQWHQAGQQLGQRGVVQQRTGFDPARGGSRDGIDFRVLEPALLAITLGAYALGMTIGRGRFGVPNVALLGGAAMGAAIFARVVYGDNARVV